MMPYFRFIIEGSDFEVPCVGDEGGEPTTGFFTTRRAKGADEASAQRLVLQALRDEWSAYSPTLNVLDSWKSPAWELRRIPNKGHAFFSDELGRYAAASIEAEASRAPKSARIWQIAALDVEDDDD